MSTIKSSAEHLTLNADGASKDIKFQANGVEKASISSSGAFTSTTIDATALTGNLPAISGASLTGITTGKVLQVVQAFDNTHISQSNNTEYTQLAVTITPTATSSKILVMLSIGGWSHSSTLDSGIMVVRDSTNLQVGQGGTRNTTISGTHNTGGGELAARSVQLLDSPATTSAITYKVYGHINNGTWKVNRRGSDTTTAVGSRMICMEIGA